MSSDEWNRLCVCLDQNTYGEEKFSNQFYHRLVITLNDEAAGIGDICSAYRDALCACPQGDDYSAELTKRRLENVTSGRSYGIDFNATGKVVNKPEIQLASDEGTINLHPIYSKVRRGNISKFPIDQSLKSRLPELYKYYNGRAQEAAVRLSLLAEPNSTTIVNLPTGSGKTLIAHAVSLYSRTLTLVIVPITALAIDQGKRATQLFRETGVNVPQCLHWDGQQTDQEHQDIKDQIRNGTQKILFVSPEAACKSLLVTLFDISRSGRLENVILDEAHMIDEWGAEFRPYYQIFSALLRALRAGAPEGIKCYLMSATFTEKSLATLRSLFCDEDHPKVEVHGAFLRSEIQYSVQRLEVAQHKEGVLSAIRLLPKPLILYVLTPQSANDYYFHLGIKGFKRIGVFTGNTSSSERKVLLDKWDEDQVDIMVATAAFGMGIDKSNVRSILHAEIPPNVDTFYQQVGRSGRDGIASQSLIIFHEGQFNQAEQQNNTTLISPTVGLTRWEEMCREQRLRGGIYLNLCAQPRHIDASSDANIMWNWKTLLLMQRAGMIKLTFEAPNPPTWDPALADARNIDERTKYFETYFNQVGYELLVDDLHDIQRWNEKFSRHRDLEKERTRDAFSELKKWILDSNHESICKILQNFYKIKGFSPQSSCGGCPGCRVEIRGSNILQSLGSQCTVFGTEDEEDWKAELIGYPRNLKLYYVINERNTRDRLLKRDWRKWICDLIESGTIKAIRADGDVLKLIESLVSVNYRGFWISIHLGETRPCAEWPELVLVMPDQLVLPKLDSRITPRLLVAPENIVDEDGVKWWEREQSASPLRGVF